ncbi:MAG: hypothetical protein WAM82_02995 [Thermoanaerobaculia bacterium]
MRTLHWTGLMIALAAAAVMTGCGVEVYDSPGYPGGSHGRGRYDDRHGVEGTVLRVSHRDHVIVVDPGEDGGRGRRDGIALFYDDDTTVEFQGRDYRPEDLERGDRIHASVDWRQGRPVAEEIEVLYDVSSGAPAPQEREGFKGEGEPDAAALRGIVRGVDVQHQTLEVEPAQAAAGDSDDDGADSDLVAVRYDAQTTVEYQGRSYGPENLEDGDVVEIRLRPGPGGRPVAGHIRVLGESGQASPSRSRTIGSAQTPSTRQPRISSSPAITSDQNPRAPMLLGR